MTARDRILEAIKDKPDDGFAKVSASDVVQVAGESEDPRVAILAGGAASVIESYRKARAEFGKPPLVPNDPRLNVYQLAGELRHMLAIVGGG